MISDRDAALTFLHGLPALSATERVRMLHDALAPDACWRVAHPVGDLIGAEAIATGLFAPLAEALPGHMRRDEIFMGGTSRTHGGEWVAALGHYVGNLAAPLFGVPAHGKLVFFRYGEFYRLDGGRIAEAVILFDLVDLMRQAGRMPFPAMLGSEMLFPSPATHDGVLPAGRERSTKSAELVEAMLRDLHIFDPATYASAGQTGDKETKGYWHRDMLWYGPGGIGSNFTYRGFERDHRFAFLTAFPDRKGGNHFARFGDGDYVCSGGWPSMTATHAGDYLGVRATNRPVTVRVMDFWRVAGDQIMENWVLIDMPHLFLQLDVDLIDRARSMQGGA